MLRTEFTFLTITLLLIGSAFPATAAPTDVLTILIKTSPGAGAESIAAARQMAGALTARDYIVTLPVKISGNPPVADAVIIVTGGVETLRGTYVSVSTLSLHATILTGNPLRIIARLDRGGEVRWRLPSNCAPFCQITLARQKAQQAATLLATRVTARISRLHRSGRIIATLREDPDITLSFRNFDAASLAELERFLRRFPEAGELHVIHTGPNGTSYRYGYGATARLLNVNLRRALTHLRIAADIDRDGRKFVIRKGGNTATTTSTDW
jgi:hypothetical protein